MRGEDNMNEFMKLAKKSAEAGLENQEGGPFGAVIINKNGEVISVGNNRVLIDKDPTAHAEMVAIRRASEKLNTYDLSDMILYTSCEPCPMCLSAIIWANIKEVYYACTKKDAAQIGFRDDMIYEYLKGNKKDVLNIKQLDREECIQLFNKYKNEDRTIY